MHIPADAQPTLEAFLRLVRDTLPAEAGLRPAPDAWTLKEIVGHLIDSASNNHQRFVRLQFGSLEHFPPYEAEPWVAAQRYAEADWTSLALLWKAYNDHLLHVIQGIPEAALANAWQHPDGPKTLEFLVRDYYAHLSLHVDHYATRLAEVRAMG
ncbi:DinB family protein [Desulfocurvus vexinensis]|uniref:DinB family protein n=1 Tax=Desulfocurvus vexinensis TaxID=399548 RepID=UPI0004BBB3A2|nr:DinB family protein [Desulfocurvus vexinensis]